MNSSANTYGMTMPELEELALELGSKKYSGRQIYQWMYQKSVYDFKSMTNLSKNLRAKLQESHTVQLPSIRDKLSSEDGTVKYLLGLSDGSHIETVKIPDDPRMTLCVSSQVGCPLDCKFCRTGQLGHKRNLSTGEILAQIALVQNDLPDNERISNLVFMGMGEPFLNYHNLVDALAIIMDVLGFGIGHRKITVSTAGHVPGIYKFTDDGIKARLAVSLNAADQDVRGQIMPIAKKFPLDQLHQAALYHTRKAKRRITFEYLMISGITDTIEMAKKLVNFIQGIPCKINLINFNPTSDLPPEFRPSKADDLLAFRDYLYPRAPAVTIRASKGSDIAAACGQLAGKKTD